MVFLLDLKKFSIMPPNVSILYVLGNSILCLLYFLPCFYIGPEHKSIVQFLTFVQQSLGPKLKNVLFSSFEKREMLTLHSGMGSENENVQISYMYVFSCLLCPIIWPSIFKNLLHFIPVANKN